MMGVARAKKVRTPIDVSGNLLTIQVQIMNILLISKSLCHYPPLLFRLEKNGSLSENVCNKNGKEKSRS